MFIATRGKGNQNSKLLSQLKEKEEIIIKNDKRLKECEDQITSLLDVNKKYVKEIKSKEDYIDNLKDKLEDKNLEITQINQKLNSSQVICEELKRSLKLAECEIESLKNK